MSAQGDGSKTTNGKGGEKPKDSGGAARSGAKGTDEKGRPQPLPEPGCWFVYWDGCGLACAIVAWVVKAFAHYGVVVHLLWPWFFHPRRVAKEGVSGWGVFHMVVFQLLVLMMWISHLRAMASNPGAVPRKSATLEDKERPESDDPSIKYLPRRRWCSKCECIKPPRAHHCSICGRCIDRMDHHCPWVNNCVGHNNVKFFLQYLFYVFLGSCYAIGLGIARLVVCNAAGAQCGSFMTVGNIVSLISCILAVFFAFFTGAMFCDQWEAMTTNTTGVESLKEWYQEDRALYEGLVDWCGERIGWRWLCPTSLPKETRFEYNFDYDDFDVRDPVVARHLDAVYPHLEAEGLIAPAASGKGAESRTGDAAADAQAAKKKS